ATATHQLYVFKGRSRDGKVVEGEMAAASAAMAKAQLRKQGILPRTVRKKPKPLFGQKKIKPANIATFTRQLATMTRAGVPLVQSFEIVAEGEENSSMKTLIERIHADVSSGTGFAAALRAHPKYFDNLFCSLIDAGEQSGTLETMLARVATYKEKTEALKRKIKKAMTYPSAVILVAIVVTGVLLIKVVPVFAETYDSFGGQLPAFTRLILNISELVQAWWLGVVAAAVAIGVAFSQARFRSPRFAALVDKLALKLPIVGNIFHDAVIARFSRTLSTTFAAGVPLIEALQSVAGAAGNAVYRDAINKVRDEVATGITLNTAMRGTGVFPVMLLQLTAIGEESGALDEMLSRAADHYEEAVDNAVDNLTTLLEPMIMAVLGVLVGGLLIGMYLPIFNLGNVL
ncbi:MAG TPA: type II secretion system F family protein, partial [Porticoccaceae bacterium]|nr:type II secretion system F family protein [Porticoccaceae bacterium]